MSSITLTAGEYAEVINRAINAGIVIAAEALCLEQVERDRLFHAVGPAREKKRREITGQKPKKGKPK